MPSEKLSDNSQGDDQLVDVPASVQDFTGDVANLPPKNFVSEAKAEPSSEPVHVISMIPGIRDLGIWVDQFEFYSQQNGLRIHAEPVTQGRTSSIYFLTRLGARARELETALQLRQIHDAYPNAKHSIIAHSYGTEMLGRIIHRVPHSYVAIFLCGAVVPPSAAGRLLSKTKTLINDCSLRDIWPLVAESLNPRFYQATGTHGLHAIGVRNRFHECGHGHYLSTEHFERYVIPVLVRRAEVDAQQPRPTWTSHLPVYAHRLLSVLLIALVASVVWMVWHRYG